MLKLIMSEMAIEERTNQALVSALEEFNNQPSVPGNQALISVLSALIQPSLTALIVGPLTLVAVTTAGDPLPQASIVTAAQSYLATNFKLQSIIKR